MEEKGDYDKIHPTQKPVNLLRHLIEIFTDEGDVVIDPVAGSGTTLIAAFETNRNSYGFEVDRNFYQSAKKMIEKQTATRQVSIFDVATR